MRENLVQTMLCIKCILCISNNYKPTPFMHHRLINVLGFCVGNLTGPLWCQVVFSCQVVECLINLSNGFKYVL